MSVCALLLLLALVLLVLPPHSRALRVIDDDDTEPDIIVLSPVNGEVYSALPMVISYRIIGVDVVEVPMPLSPICSRLGAYTHPPAHMHARLHAWR